MSSPSLLRHQLHQLTGKTVSVHREPFTVSGRMEWVGGDSGWLIHSVNTAGNGGKVHFNTERVERIVVEADAPPLLILK